MTGEDADAEELFAAYDEDGDGQLSEEETQAALEANRPDGTPPAPEEDNGALASSSWAQTSGIENYMMIASLGKDQNQSSAISAIFDGGAFSSSGSLFSVNTMV